MGFKYKVDQEVTYLTKDFLYRKGIIKKRRVVNGINKYNVYWPKDYFSSWVYEQNLLVPKVHKMMSTPTITLKMEPKPELASAGVLSAGGIVSVHDSGSPWYGYRGVVLATSSVYVDVRLFNGANYGETLTFTTSQLEQGKLKIKDHVRHNENGCVGRVSDFFSSHVYVHCLQGSQKWKKNQVTPFAPKQGMVVTTQYHDEGTIVSFNGDAIEVQNYNGDKKWVYLRQIKVSDDAIGVHQSPVMKAAATKAMSGLGFKDFKPGDTVVHKFKNKGGTVTKVKGNEIYVDYTFGNDSILKECEWSPAHKLLKCELPGESIAVGDRVKNIHYGDGVHDGQFGSVVEDIGFAKFFVKWDKDGKSTKVANHRLVKIIAGDSHDNTEEGIVPSGRNPGQMTIPPPVDQTYENGFDSIPLTTDWSQAWQQMIEFMEGISPTLDDYERGRCDGIINAFKQGMVPIPGKTGIGTGVTLELATSIHSLSTTNKNKSALALCMLPVLKQMNANFDSYTFMEIALEDEPPAVEEPEEEEVPA